MMEINPSSIYTCPDSQIEGELVVNEVNGTWFVKSGVKQLEDAFTKGEKFVAVTVDAAYVPQLMDEAAYQAFAQKNGFTYKKYPTEKLFEEKSFMKFK